MRYQLDRSDDNGTNWATLDANIQGTSYVDTTTKFDAPYKYRLAANNSAGTSGYIYADITTSSFVANAGPDSSITLQSDDKVVSVTIPVGALEKPAACSVQPDTQLGSGPSVKGYVLAGGPYNIVCKDKDGNAVTSFKQPVDVSVAVQSFKKYAKLAYYSSSSDSTWKAIGDINHRTSDKTDNFQLSDSTGFAIMGQPHHTPLWISLLLWLFILGVLGAGGYFGYRWYIQYRLKEQYEDYYRKSQGL